MKTLSDYKEEFMRLVSVNDIKWEWDSGHAYNYIDHPFMEEINEVGILALLSEQEFYELEDFTNDWLSENGDCMPCQPGCCDSHMTQEEKEEVIVCLMNYKG